MKYTTPKRKEDILNAIITLWKDADKEFAASPDNKYLRGRYTAVLDLLKMVPINEKEDK